ncbi:Na(+)-translocating NADH-quinone reductase subunit C [Methylophaga lonarensis MPL]|uniref:Na(+)-translocating NADH-quinone reductase subunit C n=1 Tax=Methylophaga lonarensis MPL TaxID=1286106 RepID=M7P3G4_9GAMM|nr:Na(+)-translocating NADH-quinone reductase subunit C [Methylophaga lonarensis]EMR14057.1 Na(+)-translocating NADH-quinone reductase subunit C [Methylophaga lonarensis MPL]
MSLPNDDPRKTLLIAILLCLACSILVSTAAVALKPLQQANKENDIKRNILAVTGVNQEAGTLDELFARFEVQLVDLATGEYADTDIEPTSFDQRRAASDPSTSTRLSSAQDIAGIGSRSDLAPVYILRDGDEIDQVVLPVHGYGLWSTMYGFLSLEGDFETIRGLQFYEHGETPGLGGEIDNPRWRSQWQGKKIYDDNDQLNIRVLRGYVDADSPQAKHQVDGLSGATLTAQGVSNLVNFWLGEHGFGPYLQRMRNEAGVI